MVFGYARVSTKKQENDRQVDALRSRSCDEIFTEKISGVKKERPELVRLREKVRKGDVVVVESWSRLGRSTRDLLEQTAWFDAAGVSLVSLKEGYDTSTPQGKLMLTLFQALAEFERDLIVQRTNEGLQSARARGRIGGRPRVKSQNIELAIRMHRSAEYTIREIREATGIPQSTLYRYLRESEE